MDIIEGESDVSVLKEKLWNGNNVILVSHYNDKGELSGGADNTYYFGLSLGDTIQFYENGVPTEAFTVIAKAAVTSNEMALTGGGSNICQSLSDIEREGWLGCIERKPWRQGDGFRQLS